MDGIKHNYNNTSDSLCAEYKDELTDFSFKVYLPEYLKDGSCFF